MAERNALAELAERLGEITSAWRPSEPTEQYAVQSISYVRKAQRIVAALAKVKLNGVGWPGRIELADAYENCRAIAEEGAEDDNA